MSAILAYGLPLYLEEDELPWKSEEYDGDAEVWWAKINGWQPPKECWTPDGNRIPGVTEAEICEYFDSQRQFMRDHPLPFNEVYHGAGEGEIFLAFPGEQYVVEADCGEVEPVDMARIAGVPTKEQTAAFIEVIAKYVDVPEWYRDSREHPPIAERLVGWYLLSWYED